MTTIPAATLPALFSSRLTRLLRVPIFALMALIFVAGPLLTLPETARAAHPGHTPATGGSNPQGQGPPPPMNPIDYCSPSELSYCISGIFYLLFVALTAEIVYFGGVIFDFVAAIALDGGTYADALINKGWTIARDIANMAFVFLLVYLAFQLILNIEGVGVGKMLAKLIVVALLINFSFFFSRVVIDASNLLAHQFYDHIRGRTVTTSGPGDIRVSDQPLAVKHISENVMNGLNVQQVISSPSFQAFMKPGGLVGNTIILIGLFFMFGAINLILAFVFFTAAVQFLSRIVALWLAVILSPIGFISFVIPGLSKFTHGWWDGLIRNAFFAPAFLFIFYIIVTFLDAGLLGSNIGQPLYSGQAAAAGAGGVDGFFRPLVTIMIRLLIVVGLLFAALKVGSYFGQASASTIMGGARKIGGMGAGLALGGAGFLGRNTLGRLAYAGSRNEGLRKSADGGSRSALYTWRALNKMGSSTYDARAAAPAAAAALGMGKASTTSRADVARANEKALRKEQVLLKDTRTEAKARAEREPARNVGTANVNADTANVAVGQNIELAQAIRELSEGVRLMRESPAIKDLEKEASANQAGAKIERLDKTREQEQLEREREEKSKNDDEIHRAVMEGQGYGELGKFIKEEEDNALFAQLHESTNLASAAPVSKPIVEPAPMSAPAEERSGAAVIQQEKDPAIAQAERSQREAENRNRTVANIARSVESPRPDGRAGDAAPVDPSTRNPQDSGKAEKADA